MYQLKQVIIPRQVSNKSNKNVINSLATLGMIITHHKVIECNQKSVLINLVKTLGHNIFDKIGN